MQQRDGDDADERVPTPTPAPAWPTTWLEDRQALPPSAWGRAGLVLVFHVGCAGCVSRAVPWLAAAAERSGDAIEFVAVHSSLGRTQRASHEVEPTLRRFVRAVRLDVPVALDLDGSWAEAAGAEGTPHWFAYDADGRRTRSVFGSQANALTRLDYLLEELSGA